MLKSIMIGNHMITSIRVGNHVIITRIWVGNHVIISSIRVGNHVIIILIRCTVKLKIIIIFAALSLCSGNQMIIDLYTSPPMNGSNKTKIHSLYKHSVTRFVQTFCHKVCDDPPWKSPHHSVKTSATGNVTF